MIHDHIRYLLPPVASASFSTCHLFNLMPLEKDNFINTVSALGPFTEARASLGILLVFDTFVAYYICVSFLLS